MNPSLAKDAIFYDSPAPSLPKPLGVADAMRAIEVEVPKMKQAHKDMRYGYLLRQLPPWVLEGMLWAMEGDESAARVLAYLTIRLGGVVHGNKNPVILAGDDEAQATIVERVCKVVWVDVCREIMRSKGYLDFAPCVDPFRPSSTQPRRLELTKEGKSLKGEEGQQLQSIVDGVKPEVASSN